MLIKVNAAAALRSEIIEIAQIFRARVVDVSEDSLTVEVAGDPGKMVAIIQNAEQVWHPRNCPDRQDCLDTGIKGKYGIPQIFRI